MATGDSIDNDLEGVSGDDDIDDRSHKKLLNAVSLLYRKQRITAPKRNEPAQQISEFNLSKSDNKKKIVASDLLQGLDKKMTHKQITTKVKSIQQKAKPLPKPLEKLESDKITRQMGFHAVKTELFKWEATIQRNRAADQLRFPLKDETVSKERDDDFLNKFTKPTELELKMAQVLKKNLFLLEGEKDGEDLEKLTLDEVLKRRNMIAKLRARESYRIAKAVRQNKIKSKKYHRMLKRDKIKKELKEFELLQKTDPEAALAKLEKVERARAEERISLRHKNTGKWAKGLAIRAKYDVEARAQLADNLRKSRELTEKIKSAMVSDSDDEADECDVVIPGSQSATNPWVGNSENEIESFVRGYRRYWENQSALQKESASKKSEIAAAQKAHSSAGNSNEESEDEDLEPDTFNECNEEDTSDLTSSNVKDDVLAHNEDQVETPCVESEKQPAVGIIHSKGKASSFASEKLDVFEPEPSPSIPVQQGLSSLKKKAKTKTVSDDSTSSANPGVSGERITTPISKKRNSKAVFDIQLNSCNEDVVRVETPKSDRLDVAISERNSPIIPKPSPNQKKKERKKTQSFSNDRKGEWSVVQVIPVQEDGEVKDSATNQGSLLRKKRKIEDMFEDVETLVEEKVPAKVAEMKRKLQMKRKDKYTEKRDQKDSDHNDLAFKKSKPSFDESLIEESREGISSGMCAVQKIIDRVGQPINISETKLPDIDPNKFIPVKTQKLKTVVPQFEEAGDSESEDDQRLNLMEAFADDDIADEFRKEKEEEEQSSQPKEVDLSLPGWGDWGGAGLATKKKKHMVVKFPKKPRKDSNMTTIIINDDPPKRFKDLQVSDLPTQFSNVAAYEATIRAPIGDTWIPQAAHSALTQPQLITRMGAIIEPIDASQLPAEDNLGNSIVTQKVVRNKSPARKKRRKGMATNRSKLNNQS